MPFIGEVSMTTPPSQVEKPAMVCAPPRTATGSPSLRANSTARITSAVRPVVLASVEQDQAEVEQHAEPPRSVFHLLEEQQRLPQQPIGLPQVPRGRGDQALVHQRDTDPAPVAEATPDPQAALKQLPGLRELTGDAVHVGQVAQRQPLTQIRGTRPSPV
jgi:hypothetical protein